MMGGFVEINVGVVFQREQDMFPSLLLVGRELMKETSEGGGKDLLLPPLSDRPGGVVGGGHQWDRNGGEGGEGGKGGSPPSMTLILSSATQ